MTISLVAEEYVIDATFGRASSEMGVVRAQIRFSSDISPLETVGRSFPARLTDPLASTWSVSSPLLPLWAVTSKLVGTHNILGKSFYKN